MHLVTLRMSERFTFVVKHICKSNGRILAQTHNIISGKHHYALLVLCFIFIYFFLSVNGKYDCICDREYL